MKQPSLNQLKTDMYAFWKKHAGSKRKEYTEKQRIELVRQFTREQRELWDEHLAYEYEQAHESKRVPHTLMDMKIVHPAYFKKSSFRMASIYDILADFIAPKDLKIFETVSKYPVYTEAQEYSRTMQRYQSEIAIFDVESDDQEMRQPYGTISTDDVSEILANKPEQVEVTAESMYALIDEWKADINETARELQRIYGGNIADIKKKIRKLKHENVKECKECGEVFYATDKRMEVCGLTKDFKQVDGEFIPLEKSACWNKRNAAKKRRNTNKCSI